MCPISDTREAIYSVNFASLSLHSLSKGGNENDAEADNTGRRSSQDDEMYISSLVK